MFSRIVFGTDLSDASDAVLDCLATLEGAGIETLTIAHVVNAANTPGMETILLQLAEPRLREQADRLRQAGLEVHTDLRVGVPAVTLADLAAERDASVIVVGSHGRSALARLMLGSVSSGILQHTTRPVLVVRVALGEGKEAPRCPLRAEGLLSKVFFATDFSDSAEAAFSTLLRLVEQTRPAVAVGHVQDTVQLRHLQDRIHEFDQIDRQRLDRLRAALLEAGATEVTVRLARGRPAPEIVRLAQEESVGMIVMATRGRGAFGEIMVGSVALNVTRMSPVPVLLLPSR